ncbi:hypothetical protein [Streptosporangium roseum]|nr:hypothetical protein [Streptosporangium roseum]
MNPAGVAVAAALATAAVVILVRARGRRAELLRRRCELEDLGDPS